MLHTQVLQPSTLELLKSLQTKNYLDNFYLAGGTALALYYGHRVSIDIDIFSNTDFDTAGMLESIQQDYNIQLFFTAENTIKGSINSVNIDIIAHKYPQLKEPIINDNLRLLSEPDILAMKLNAISISGQRSKDFIDIYYALDHYNIRKIISFYQQKYSQQGETHILKSLIYFKDADLSDWPVLIKNPGLKWSEVKERIEKAVFEFINSGIGE